MHSPHVDGSIVTASCARSAGLENEMTTQKTRAARRAYEIAET